MVRSSLAAKAGAMLDWIYSALYTAALLNELIYDKWEQNIPIHCVTDDKWEKNISIHCVTDDQSLCDALASNKYVTEKRLRIDIGALKEAIKNNDIKHISWVKKRMNS